MSTYAQISGFSISCTHNLRIFPNEAYANFRTPQKIVFIIYFLRKPVRFGHVGSTQTNQVLCPLFEIVCHLFEHGILIKCIKGRQKVETVYEDYWSVIKLYNEFV